MLLNRTKFNFLIYYFFIVLIVYLPFQRLLEHFFLFRGFSESLAFWATHWYEPLVIILFLFLLIQLITQQNRDKTINGLSILALVLVALSVISILMLSPSISRGIEGFRFTIFFLLAFLAAYWSGLSQTQTNKLTNVYLIMAGIFALWGILERFLPANYLVNWGLISADSNFGYGTNRVVDVLQSVTGIGGPNQLASYLLPAVFISLYKISNIKDKKYYYWILISACIITIILSFSRSAWIGLYAGLLVSAIIFVKNSWIKIGSIIILLALAAGIGFYYLNKPNDILTHGASDAGHQTALQTSLDEIKNRVSQPVILIFGSGIGTAGPAALKYGDGFISESWYLQLALEFGIIGLALWLVFVLFLLLDLYKKNAGLFVALTSISVVAIFLHSWSDNPAVAITLFVLVGLNVSTNTEKLSF